MNLVADVKEVVVHAVRLDQKPEQLPDDFPLAGENLDSMAVTNLVVSLEEHFGFTFDDEDLSAEAFETVATLTDLVESKLD